MILWKCGVCGYVSDEEAPNKCPKCGAPKERFTKLDDATTELIEKSRVTNDLHMEIESKLNKIAELAEKGIQESLDPACVAIFKRAKKDAYEIRQMIKAEIETHVEKRKWG